MGEAASFIAFLLLSVAAVVGGWRWGRHGGRSAGIGAFLGAALALGKAVLSWRTDLEFALVPNFDYALFEGWIGYPPVLLVLGIGAGRLREWRTRRAVLVLAIVVFLFAAWRESWLIFPAATTGPHGCRDDHHCEQSTQWTCGAAAAATLLSLHGCDVTEQDMAVACGVRPGIGTNLWRIGRAVRDRLRGRGYCVRLIRTSAETARKRGYPILVAASAGHAGVIRFTADRTILHDPEDTHPSVITAIELDARIGDVCLVVEPIVNGFVERTGSPRPR